MTGEYKYEEPASKFWNPEQLDQECGGKFVCFGGEDYVSQSDGAPREDCTPGSTRVSSEDTYYMCDKVVNGKHSCGEGTYSKQEFCLAQERLDCESKKGTGVGFSTTLHCEDPEAGTRCDWEGSHSPQIFTATVVYFSADLPRTSLLQVVSPLQQQCERLPMAEFKAFGVATSDVGRDGGVSK